jgi:hypothetical protein
MKPLLIGQAPSRKGDPAKPLSRDPLASRLAHLCGLTKEEYLDAFERVNILDAWPGKCGKGDAFPLAETRRNAALITADIRNERVVLLGKSVARSFGIKANVLKWFRFGAGRAIVLPHPSGVNRWYNDENNVIAARRIMRRLCKTKQRRPITT